MGQGRGAGHGHRAVKRVDIVVHGRGSSACPLITVCLEFMLNQSKQETVTGQVALGTQTRASSMTQLAPLSSLGEQVAAPFLLPFPPF